jgi:hypothetical protein
MEKQGARVTAPEPNIPASNTQRKVPRSARIEIYNME